MMQKPFISFIVPVYNVEAYLHQCVDSIINQTCSDWELILIDDGSCDGSSRICDEYARRDNRIKVIHQANQGVAVARNAGLDTVTGVWIWFVDSDDWIELDAVSTLKSNYVKRMGAISDLIMFGHIRHEGNQVVLNKEVDKQGVEKDSFLSSQVSFFNPCMAFKNDVIRKQGLRFTKGIRLAEDLEFQYKYEILCQYPISIAEPLYHYRIREGSATHNNAYRKYAVDDLYLVLKNLYEFIVDHQVEPAVWLNMRLEMLMKNLLYSASLVRELDCRDFQERVREIVKLYRKINFTCFESKKIQLAYWSVSVYFVTNKMYLKMKGIS